MSAELLEKYLGPGTADSPRATLGLVASVLRDTDIIAALQAQLAKVSAHPDGSSSEADEVRLALHAAAAQLLDPRGRGEAPPGTSPGPTSFEALVVLTLAQNGGWTPRAQQRVLQLAALRGVETADLLKLLQSFTGRRVDLGMAPARREGPPRAAASQMPSSARAEARVEDEFAEFRSTSRRGPNVVLLSVAAGVVVLVSAAAIIGGSMLLRPAPPAAGGAGTTTPGTTAMGSPAGTSARGQAPREELFPAARAAEETREAAAPARTAPRAREWDDVRRDLVSCTEALASDPEGALARLDELIEEISRTWVSAPPDGLIASNSALVEFIYRAASHGSGARVAVDAIARRAMAADAPEAGPESLRQSVWGAGMLGRLSRERDLPASAARRVESVLSELNVGAFAGDDAFRSAAATRLSALADRLTRESAGSVERRSAAWTAWLESTDAALQRGTTLHNRAVLAALEGLLLAGPEATVDRAAFDAISMLAGAASWREGDEARRWLLRWFDDARVSQGDLQTVTSTLARRSAAPGVDASMVLSIAASETQRAELRDRYASVWGMRAGPTRDEAMVRWGELAQGKLAGAEPSTPIEALSRAAVLSRLNRLAGGLWWGQAEPLEASAIDLPATVPITGSGGGVVSTNANPYRSVVVFTNNDWSTRYLAAGQNIPQRRELLSQFPIPPDSLQAEIVVEQAFRGVPAPVRMDAQAIVRRHVNEWTIVLAVLRLAPTMPQDVESSALVRDITFAEIPPPRDPSWRVVVRRALVERTLQVMADRGEASAIRELTRLLEEAYAPTVARPSPGTGADETIPDPAAEQQAPPATQDAWQTESPPAEVSARLLRLRWQREAEGLIPSGREPFTLADLAQRRLPREKLASGRVQAFNAEQVAIAELMALVISMEDGSKSEAARAIIEELSSRRRSASHIFEQIYASERAITQLWKLRSGGAES